MSKIFYFAQVESFHTTYEYELLALLDGNRLTRSPEPQKPLQHIIYITQETFEAFLSNPAYLAPLMEQFRERGYHLTNEWESETVGFLRDNGVNILPENLHDHISLIRPTPVIHWKGGTLQ